MQPLLKVYSIFEVELRRNIVKSFLRFEVLLFKEMSVLRFKQTLQIYLAIFFEMNITFHLLFVYKL